MEITVEGIIGISQKGKLVQVPTKNIALSFAIMATQVINSPSYLTNEHFVNDNKTVVFGGETPASASSESTFQASRLRRQPRRRVRFAPDVNVNVGIDGNDPLAVDRWSSSHGSDSDSSPSTIISPRRVSRMNR